MDSVSGRYLVGSRVGFATGNGLGIVVGNAIVGAMVGCTDGYLVGDDVSSPKNVMDQYTPITHTTRYHTKCIAHKHT